MRCYLTAALWTLSDSFVSIYPNFLFYFYFKSIFTASFPDMTVCCVVCTVCVVNCHVQSVVTLKLSALWLFDASEESSLFKKKRIYSYCLVQTHDRGAALYVRVCCDVCVWIFWWNSEICFEAIWWVTVRSRNQLHVTGAFLLNEARWFDIAFIYAS